MSSTKDNTQDNPLPTTSPPSPIFTNSTDRLLYDLLAKKSPMTRNELVQATGIARSTIYDALLRMILKKLVRTFSNKPTSPGRPKVYFEVIRYPPASPAPAITATM